MLHETSVYTAGYERAGRVENRDFGENSKCGSFVIFFFIASCSISLEMPIRIALYGKISLPVSFINGQGQSFWNFPRTDASQLG